MSLIELILIFYVQLVCVENVEPKFVKKIDTLWYGRDAENLIYLYYINYTEINQLELEDV